MKLELDVRVKLDEEDILNAVEKIFLPNLPILPLGYEYEFSFSTKYASLPEITIKSKLSPIKETVVETSSVALASEDA